MGNLVKTIFPDGTFITAEYDVKGHKISETNQLGQTRSFEYSDMGQLTAVILPGNLRYEYDYNILGVQTLIRDPNGHETRFNYDNNGRLLSRTLPLGFGQDGILGTEDDVSSVDYTEYFEYDDFGRTVKSISFEGIITTYHYDDLDRLQSKKFYNDSVAYTQQNPSDVWNYTYDEEDRIIRLQQNDHITINAYNHKGYLISVSTPEGTLSYTYNDWGQQTSVSTNTGETTSYTYDNLGRLATVSSIAGTTSYSYDIYGNLAKTVLPNGCITTYEYDIMNRLVRLTNYVDTNNNGQMDSEEGISKFDYTLDALGRKTSAEETFWLDNNNDGIKETNTIHTSWTYDLQSRLVREVIDHYDDLLDQTLDWTYDLTGNRLTQSLDKGNDSSIDEVTRYLYDANDRLIDELFDGQNDGTFEKTTSYGYDHTEQTSKTVEENNQKTTETAYEYNALGQMSVVIITKFTDGVASSREKITYTYNIEGIRVGAIHEIDSNCDGTPETTTRTEYLNDTDNHTGYSEVLKQTDFDSNNTVIKEIYYTIGHDQIAQTVTTAEATQSHYFTFDGHGSTRLLLDSALAILQIYGYDAYGNAIGFNPDQALTEYLYSGEQFDSRIGQQYLRARYYDPATGRFNSLDSFFGNLSDPQSLHKYLYAHANPVNMTDPTGLFGLGGISVSMSMMSGMNAAQIQGVSAAGAFAGGVAGALIGGYSGYLQGLMSYDFDEMDSVIAAVLWAMVGGIAGASPGLYGAGQYGGSGAGIGAFQGMVDSALGYNDPISAAVDGLSSAIIGAGIGSVAQLLSGGLLCKIFANPLGAIIGTSLLTTVSGYGVYQGASGVKESYDNGNYLQSAFRGIMTIVDVVSFAKSLKFCFVDDTYVLQAEMFEDQSVINESQEKEQGKVYKHSRISYILASIAIASLGGLTIIICKDNEEVEQFKVEIKNSSLSIPKID